MKRNADVTILDRLSGLVGQASGSGLRAQLVKAGIGSLAVRVGNIVLGLVLTIVLARTLGPESYGIYAYVFALISIISIPARFGLPRLVIRETAKAQVNEQWGVMRGIWRWATAVAGVLSLVLSLAALGILWVVAERFSQLQLTTFLWGLALMPLIVFGSLRGAALQGLRRVVLGRLPEAILRPAFLILLILLAVWWNGLEQVTAATAMSFNALAAGLAFLVGVLLLRRSRPPPLIAGQAPVYETRLWFAAVLPLALTSGMHQITQYTDIIMLGVFVSAEDVGVYRVAVQGGALVIFGLQTVTMFVSPYFARLYVQEDHVRLRRLLTTCARISFLTALPIVLIFAFWGDVIIRSFFGESYVHAHLPLVILGLGYLINALFGPLDVLLNMTGHELDTMRSKAIAACANILLNLILIPYYGMSGAALATALSSVIWSVSLWIYAKKSSA